MVDYLNLDDPETWIKEFYDIVNEKNTWEYILNSYDGSNYGESFLELLLNKEDY